MIDGRQWSRACSSAQLCAPELSMQIDGYVDCPTRSNGEFVVVFFFGCWVPQVARFER